VKNHEGIVARALSACRSKMADMVVLGLNSGRDKKMQEFQGQRLRVPGRYYSVYA
jgi:hypothetical protein